MIVTLTLNPSLDRTVEVEALRRGTMVRTTTPVLEPGGKGVNVARALTANGIPALAIVTVAGPEGAELSRLLERDGVLCRFVPVSGRTRSNLTVCEPDGTVTKLNEPGCPFEEADVAQVLTAIRTGVRDGDWFVLSGSTPPGLAEGHLSAILAGAAASGAHLVVDTSGPALATALDARPRLIKPNLAELAELSGREPSTIAEVRDAAESVRARGPEYVLVSMGADGAMLVGPDGMLLGESRVDRPRSTVGAGDSFLAGFLSRFSQDESDVEAALLEALDWGAAATRLPGSAVPSPSDLDPESVRLVWQPDPDRPLVASEQSATVPELPVRRSTQQNV
ncbi:MAG: 1-phosphofructokinase family hexose kinase [Schumannella sp.]